MKKIIFAFSICLLLFSCSEHEFEVVKQEGVQFVQNRFDFPVFEDEPTTTTEIDVAVTTLSSQDRTYFVSINPDRTSASENQYSLVSNQVIIPANSYVGKLAITSSYSSLSDEDVFLELVLDNSQPVVVGKENVSVRIFKGCSENLVNLNFNFDGYASEITWEIKNSSNTTVASGGGYADGQQSATENICLPSGDYTLIVNDSYGDGLSFPSNGSFNVSLNGVVLASGGGNFGFQISVGFVVP